MNKGTFFLLCAVALLCGCIAYLLTDPEPAVETAKTDAIIEQIKETASAAVGRVEERHTKVTGEVVVIHETVRASVRELSVDSVVDSLNAELALFRGMENGFGGLDGN